MLSHDFQQRDTRGSIFRRAWQPLISRASDRHVLALNERLTFSRLHLGERIEFDALIERCSRDGAEVVAKGFGPRIRPAYHARVLPRRGGSGVDEGTRLQIANLIGVTAAALFRLRVQFLVNRLAPEDRGGQISASMRNASRNTYNAEGPARASAAPPSPSQGTGAIIHGGCY